MTGFVQARTGERGFAMVETLIATAIIAAMLGLTFQVISTASRASAMQRDQRRAALFAASVMARVGADIALAPGATDGRTDGLDWRVEIEPYRPDSSDDAPESQHLVRVAVSVTLPSSERGRIDLQSLRFAS
jgi:type II secretory pathway pseudopilin PulG